MLYPITKMDMDKGTDFKVPSPEDFCLRDIEIENQKPSTDHEAPKLGLPTSINKMQILSRME